MSSALSIPNPFADERFLQLPLEVRDDVRAWVYAFRQGAPKHTNKTKLFDYVAAALSTPEDPVSASTVRRKYYAIRSEGHWWPLVDKRKLPSPAPNNRTNNREFRTALLGLFEHYKGKGAPAFEELRSCWTYRRALPEKVADVSFIPGYEDWASWPQLPAGWSDTNLWKIIRDEQDRATTVAARKGAHSKANKHLGQILTTRIGTHVGTVIQIDDVRHDNFVSVGKRRIPARVDELGVLDLRSGCRHLWGMFPRTPKDDDPSKVEGIKESSMRLLAAAHFMEFGYHPEGTVALSENATARIIEELARILFDSTGGLIRVEYAPIEKHQALLNYWGGSEGGNPNAKAHLESIHNPIHNALKCLPGQTGRNRDERPSTTDRMIKYHVDTVAKILAMDPERAESRLAMFRSPFLDFHHEFKPYVEAFYMHGLNGRTDHHLEGWEELGDIITEYTTVPGSGQFLTSEQFAALPGPSKEILLHAIENDPQKWTRRRSRSPLEVFERGRKDLIKLRPEVAIELVGRDNTREQKVNGRYIEFSDQTITPETLIYEAILRDEDNREIRHLRDREKVEVFCNPILPDTLRVYNARGQFLGNCSVVKRVKPYSRSALTAGKHWDDRESVMSEEFRDAAKRKAQTNAQTLQPLRIRGANQSREAQELRAHNAKLVDNEAAVTPAEQREQLKERTAQRRLSAQQDEADDAFASVEYDEPDVADDPFES